MNALKMWMLSIIMTVAMVDSCDSQRRDEDMARLIQVRCK